MDFDSFVDGKLFSELVHELRGGQSVACGSLVDEQDNGPEAGRVLLEYIMSVQCILLRCEMLHLLKYCTFVQI